MDFWKYGFTYLRFVKNGFQTFIQSSKDSWVLWIK